MTTINLSKTLNEGYTRSQSCNTLQTSSRDFTKVIRSHVQEETGDLDRRARDVAARRAQHAVKPNIRFIIPAKSQGVFSLPFQRILQGFYSPE